MSRHVHDANEPRIAFSGWFEGLTHVLPVRIYYEDTDVSGIVYHANYLRYMERGRSDFLRIAGVHHLVMMEGEQRLAWTLRRITLDYARPARLDDLVQVHTRYVEMAGARLTAAQSIRRGDDVLAQGRIEAAVITLDGRPRRIPAEIVQRLKPYLAPDNSEKAS